MASLQMAALDLTLLESRQSTSQQLADVGKASSTTFAKCIA